MYTKFVFLIPTANQFSYKSMVSCPNFLDRVNEKLLTFGNPEKKWRKPCFS